MTASFKSHVHRVGAIVICAAGVASCASANASQARSTTANFPRAANTIEPEAQRASATDIHIFDPYIGRFSAKTTQDPDSGESFHYEVEYRWFDTLHSIVKFTVTLVHEGVRDSTVLAEGFYGYDPFQERLYTFAAFSWGSTGFGAVGEFDHGTGRRVTWAASQTDGVTTYVRDTFEVVDQNSWRNVTWIREGESGEWQKASEEIYVRTAGGQIPNAVQGQALSIPSRVTPQATVNHIS